MVSSAESGGEKSKPHPLFFFPRSELLLVLQSELEAWPNIPIYPSLPNFDPHPSSEPLYPHQLLPSLFQGQMLSKVWISESQIVPS